MKTSEEGLDFIERVEGVRYTSYLDTGGVWTNGVGHTGPEVVKGMKATPEQVGAWLMEDVKEAEDAVNKYVKVALTQNQFDALVSFVFNVGEYAFYKSTMLRLLNTGSYKEASEQFGRWVKDNGKTINGLVKRRAAEAALFNA
jgi:lysozyme